MAPKDIKAIVKLQLKAGQATPAPPVGPALGQHGINLGQFTLAYNEATRDRMGDVIPVEITIYEDRTFTFVTKTPPVPFLIKKLGNIPKGSGTAGKAKVGKLSRATVREIAEIKLADLNTEDINMAMRIVEGTARSMGIAVE
ncbi:MAG: 50S ribosomal protein L11 [bacterium]|nr:50S ribosomal protein L11 [bacterium]